MTMFAAVVDVAGAIGIPLAFTVLGLLVAIDVRAELGMHSRRAFWRGAAVLLVAYLALVGYLFVELGPS